MPDTHKVHLAKENTITAAEDFLEVRSLHSCLGIKLQLFTVHIEGCAVITLLHSLHQGCPTYGQRNHFTPPEKLFH